MNVYVNNKEYSFKNALRVAVEGFLREHDIHLTTLGISRLSTTADNFSINIEASCDSKIMKKTEFKSDSMWVSYGLSNYSYDRHKNPYIEEVQSIDCSFSINLHTEALYHMKEVLVSSIIDDIISQLSKSMQKLIYEKASKEFDISVEDELSSDS